MTVAKFVYLLNVIYHIPFNLNYKRWHLGPFAPEINKIIKNKKFFKIEDNKIRALGSTVSKKTTRYEEHIKYAVTELTTIFAQFNEKERSSCMRQFAR